MRNMEDFLRVKDEKRLLFIGDSITDGGTYISLLESFARINGRTDFEAYINLGVSSENTSGLTEPGHPFPRPCVLRRIDRITQVFHGGWAVVMYGENDGIYQPFDENRFLLYRQGIAQLVEKLHKANFKVILLTPTPFDNVSYKGKLSDSGDFGYPNMYLHYDTVMQKYAEWIMQCGLAEKAIDVHTPIAAYLAEKRKTDPNFKTGDGIHQGKEGNFLLAKTLADAIFGISLGTFEETPVPKIFPLVQKKNTFYHRYYKELIGHENPYKEKPISYEKLQREMKSVQKKINKNLFGEAKL